MTLNELKDEYGLTSVDIEKVVILYQLLGDDIDGIWAMLYDEGIDIIIDDLIDLQPNMAVP